MLSILALFFLLFAFGVLLYTFVWIARLLARRAEEAQRSSSPDTEDPAGPAEEEGGEPEQDEQTEAEIEQEQLQEKGVAMRSSATLGLLNDSLGAGNEPRITNRAAMPSPDQPSPATS